MKNKITQEDINAILDKTQWTVEEFHENAPWLQSYQMVSF